VRKTELKSRSISFKLLQYHVIFHTDLISSLLDPRLDDPESTKTRWSWINFNPSWYIRPKDFKGI